MVKLAGMKLRCRDGHWEFANWQIIRLDPKGPLAFIPPGYAVVTRCDLGDHYLFPDYDLGIMRTVLNPWTWPTIEDAEAAITRWEQQEVERA